MEQLIEWKEEYSVGFAPIDAQHQMLVKVLNDVHEAIQAREHSRQHMDRLLDIMILYVETHFEYEEKLMKFAEYPGLKEHFREHRDMELRIKGLSVSYGADLTDQYGIMLKVLERWLMNHILESDRQYMPALQQAFG